jgi:regulator of cell morphogenesis and NO signaling
MDVANLFAVDPENSHKGPLLTQFFRHLCAASRLHKTNVGLVRRKFIRLGDRNAMISSETKVREVALNTPGSTRVFEKFKIDYCCGGDRPLSEACAAAGVQIDTVMQLLSEVTQANSHDELVPNFQNASLRELITHILETHHVYTKSEIDRLDALIAKVIVAHGSNHPELIELGELWQSLAADLNPHMFKEERVLFPYIMAMVQAADQNGSAPFAPFGTVNNPIHMMMSEHDSAGDILRQMRSLTFDYKVPADACISYQTLYQALEGFERDLHQHIHLENNILFPKALKLENTLNR